MTLKKYGALKRRPADLNVRSQDGSDLQYVIDPQSRYPLQYDLRELLDDRGLKVDGVSYSRDQARHPGWTLTF